MTDLVQRPRHYNVFGDRVKQRAIDVIKASLTPAEYIGYCKGNILKYQLRAGKKDLATQDLAKAQQYLDMLDEYLAALEVPKDYAGVKSC